jgi:hypothetical protein
MSVRWLAVLATRRTGFACIVKPTPFVLVAHTSLSSLAQMRKP